MTIDPDSLSERTKTIDRSDLKMKDDDKQSLEDNADIDAKLIEEFDL